MATIMTVMANLIGSPLGGSVDADFEDDDGDDRDCDDLENFKANICGYGKV